MANELSVLDDLDLSMIDTSMYEDLLERDKNMLGNGLGDNYRISIKGGRFRLIYNGEQQAVSKHSSMNIVIVNSAPISRTFYEGAYDPDNPTAPTCWSPDTEKPSSDVPSDQRQAVSCRDCPQNIKGSGQGDSRACRFNIRLAVVLEGEWDRVYQLQLPATSIFGKADGNMALQAYVRLLAGRKLPTVAVVTKMYFDEDSETPKLFFKPVRALKEDEYKACLEAAATEDAERAITFTVAQTDGVQKADGTKAEKKSTPKVEKKEAKVEDDEPVEEPKKREAKASDNVSDNDDLADLVNVWDD